LSRFNVDLRPRAAALASLISVRIYLLSVCLSLAWFAFVRAVCDLLQPLVVPLCFALFAVFGSFRFDLVRCALRAAAPPSQLYLFSVAIDTFYVVVN
jgi:hypothetical protein